MGLDNIPFPYPCEGKETTIRKNDELDCDTMREKKICPVLEFGHPIAPYSTYCWFRGKGSARLLQSMDRSDLADKFFTDQNPNEVKNLLKDIKEVLEKFKQSHKNDLKAINDIDLDKIFNGVERGWEIQKIIHDNPLVSAKCTIKHFETIIKWLEMLATHNCGFKAWW